MHHQEGGDRRILIIRVRKLVFNFPPASLHSDELLIQGKTWYRTQCLHREKDGKEAHCSLLLDNTD
ncbi:hypothetical protein KIN20_035432 [Parelaphostrongylus tenuis]|uniref:Uncharacterized protein n=1 Tax=Parelaphostrongylus tenuis TaxID=148309 RepID=A0AAD5WKI3_PARTN|nr:hypothetical protein KIN20_035432 [Parelaphostrongylus tenuis]